VNAFHVLGAIFAIWAVTVAFLGIRRHDFPATKSAERLVAAISVVLFLAAVGSGIITAATEEHESEHPTEGQSRESTE
jgi:NADH:ubiquinone oxidoreductase subunit 6 (subunit J)